MSNLRKALLGNLKTLNSIATSSKGLIKNEDIFKNHKEDVREMTESIMRICQANLNILEGMIEEEEGDE